MTDSQSASEHIDERDSPPQHIANSPLNLQELYRPSTACRGRATMQWSKAPPKASLNWEVAAIPAAASTAPTPPASGELSCELGLGGWGENPRRVCRICNRHFSSGRALGGHMRVHGPLFQPAGSKRKLSSSSELVQGKPSELEHEGLSMDMSDSKQSDLSLLSKSLLSAEKNVLGKFQDADDVAVDTATESEGEAVEDAPSSRNYHVRSMVKEYDDGEDDDDGGEDIDDDYGDDEDEDDDDGGDGLHGYNVCPRDGRRNNKQSSISADSAHIRHFTFTGSSKRNPLYKLRHNPKKSRRFAEEDFAMHMFLSGQAGSGLHPSPQRSRVCSECGKSFWSWKALFGHMRCHPEREWRGILPPEDGSVERFRFSRKKLFAESRLLESSDHELDSDVEDKELGEEELSDDDCKKPHVPCTGEAEEATEYEMDGEMERRGDFSGGRRELDDRKRCWPTGKRSRRKAESVQQLDLSPQREEPALTSESGSLQEEPQQEEEHYGGTPNFLLMLAEAARKIERDTQMQKSSRLGMPHGKTKVYGEGHGVSGDKQDQGEAFFAFSAKPSMHAATSSTTGGTVKYECSTCKKSFNSHQALGGHRASHRKMKGCFARMSVGSEEAGFAEYDFVREELWQAGHDVLEKDPNSFRVPEKVLKQQQIKGHECSICHRIFATGQALGGHKRCHYIAERVPEAAASFTSSNKQACEDGYSSKLDAVEGGSRLDLNMPAPTDEDGIEITHDASAVQSRLLAHELEERTTRRSLDQEVSLSSWPRKELVGDGMRSSSWELDSRWAVGPAVAY